MNLASRNNDQDSTHCLLCQARELRCAIPLRHVVETMRPLPLRSVVGAPVSVMGMALVRGAPTPVLDCGALLGEPAPARHARWVTIRCAERIAALAFEGVLGVRDLPWQHEALSPLLRASEVVAAVAALDADLVLMLGSARLIPESLWQSLDDQATAI